MRTLFTVPCSWKNQCRVDFYVFLSSFRRLRCADSVHVYYYILTIEQLYAGATQHLKLRMPFLTNVNGALMEFRTPELLIQSPQQSPLLFAWLLLIALRVGFPPWALFFWWRLGYLPSETSTIRELLVGLLLALKVFYTRRTTFCLTIQPSLAQCRMSYKTFWIMQDFNCKIYLL